MDDDLKDRILEYFSPVELVDLVMELEDELFGDLIELLRERIEDNLEHIKELINYGD
jgi:hypothetical protein